MSAPTPPYDELAERAVLGSLLIDRDAVLHVAPRLSGDDFYLAAHRALYEAMLRLYRRRVPIDLVTLETELRQSGSTEQVGGMPAVLELVGENVTSVHVNYYADLVREASARRRALEVGETALRTAHDQSKPVERVYAEIGAALAKAATGSAADGYLSMKIMMERAYDRFQQHEERLIPFGIASLDSIFGEMRPHQLTIIAARPSMGKSAFAAQIAYYNAVKHSRRVGMISLEMTADEIAERFLSLATGADMYRVRTGQAGDQTEAAVMSAIGRLADCPFYCDDRISGDLFQVQSRAREMLAVEGIELLIVDYLQLMTSNGRENRTQEVSQISRGLKQLARELGIPVVALAQLNRNLEGRSEPRPMLSDLRESGSLEQDADRVIFIHRPDVYKPDAEKNIAELVVAKHRNGPVGTVRVRWIPEQVRFVSLTTREEP